jgi:hypothetical protein
MHEEFPDIAIAAVAAPKEPSLPTRGVLPGHQPHPGGKLPPILQVGRLADSRHKSCDCQRPSSRARQEALTDGMGRPNRGHLVVVCCQSLVQGTKLVGFHALLQSEL